MVIVPLEEAEQIEFERKYVNSVYESISAHFNSTRRKPWPVVESYIRSLEKWSIGLDVGCGNFRNRIGDDVFMMGIDNCMGLLRHCPKNSEILLGNALNLPYRDKSQDFAISVAVMHHFCSEKRRLEALREIARVLRCGGTALIYVWALEQKGKGVPKEQDTCIGWITERKGDLGLERVEFKRYYHLFREGELENLLENLDNVKLEEKGYDADNWWVKIRKTE